MQTRVAEKPKNESDDVDDSLFLLRPLDICMAYICFFHTFFVVVFPSRSVGETRVDWRSRRQSSERRTKQ